MALNDCRRVVQRKLEKCPLLFWIVQLNFFVLEERTAACLLSFLEQMTFGRRLLLLRFYSLKSMPSGKCHFFSFLSRAGSSLNDSRHLIWLIKWDPFLLLTYCYKKLSSNDAITGAKCERDGAAEILWSAQMAFVHSTQQTKAPDWQLSSGLLQDFLQCSSMGRV